MLRWIPGSLVMVSLVACASSSSLQPPVRKPDGSWHLSCGATLDNCVKQADDLCRGRGYVVISGSVKRKLYGAELGRSQYEVREAELDLACADQRGELPTVQYTVPPAAAMPTLVPAVVPVAASAAPAPAPAAPLPQTAPAPAAPATP